MKKIIPILTVIVLFAFICSGCGHSNREKRIARIDSLSTVLNEVDSMLTIGINYDSVFNKFNELKKNKEILSTYIPKLNEKEKSDYFQYISSEKHFKIIITAYDKYKRELDYSRKQLADLKGDVENKAIKKDKFEEFYNTESEAVYLLFNKVKTDAYKTQKHFEKDKIFLPLVEKLIEEKVKLSKK